MLDLLLGVLPLGIAPIIGALLIYIGGRKALSKLDFTALKPFTYTGLTIGVLGSGIPPLVINPRRMLVFSTLISCFVFFMLLLISRSVSKMVRKAIDVRKRKEGIKAKEKKQESSLEERREGIIYGIFLPLALTVPYYGQNVWSALGELMKQIMGAIVLCIILSGVLGIIACAIVILVASVAGRTMGGGAIAYFVSEIYSFLTPFLLGIALATIVLFSADAVVSALLGGAGPSILSQALEQARTYLSQMFGGV